MMNFWKIVKRKMMKLSPSSNDAHNLDMDEKIALSFDCTRHPQKLFLPRPNHGSKLKYLLIQLPNVHKIFFLDLIFNGQMLLAISSYDDTEKYKIEMFSNKINTKTHNKQKSIFKYDLNIWSTKFAVTLFSGSSLVVLGVLFDKTLALFHYSVSLENIKHLETFILPGYHYSGAYSFVSASTNDNNRFAFVLTDASRYPQPLFLYVFECNKKLTLLSFIDLKTLDVRTSGIVSDLCFTEECNSISAVTTFFQYIRIEVLSNNYQFIVLKAISLEDHEELIFLKKMAFNKSNKETILALTKTASLYNLSNNKVIELKENFVDRDKTEGLVLFVKVCQFSKLIFIATACRNVYIYDILQNKIKFIFSTPHELNPGTMHTINWYGNEMYASINNNIVTYRILDGDISLKHLARMSLLKNFSKIEILQMSCVNKLKQYIFNEL